MTVSNFSSHIYFSNINLPTSVHPISGIEADILGHCNTGVGHLLPSTVSDIPISVI